MLYPTGTISEDGDDERGLAAGVPLLEARRPGRIGEAEHVSEISLPQYPQAYKA